MNEESFKRGGRCFAIVPAAGQGLRFGGSIAKQFLSLDDRSVLEATLQVLTKAGLFDKIVVCISQEQLDIWKERLGSDLVFSVLGGRHRFESVCFGYRALDVRDDDVILVHDGVRPLVSLDLIKRVAKETQTRNAVIPVVPVVETVKVVSEGVVRKTIDRSNLFLVQTPQGFKGAFMKKMYRDMPKGLEHVTDEAMYLEELGETVYTVPGDPRNIKITSPSDLHLAKTLLGLTHPSAGTS